MSSVVDGVDASVLVAAPGPDDGGDVDHASVVEVEVSVVGGVVVVVVTKKVSGVDGGSRVVIVGDVEPSASLQPVTGTTRAVEAVSAMTCRIMERGLVISAHPATAHGTVGRAHRPWGELPVVECTRSNVNVLHSIGHTGHDRSHRPSAEAQAMLQTADRRRREHSDAGSTPALFDSVQKVVIVTAPWTIGPGFRNRAHPMTDTVSLPS